MFARWLASVAALLLTCAAASADGKTDWPMLAHDVARSGATEAEVRPPFERKWYRAFVDEGLMAGVQPVVAGGVVYVGTLHGVVHAIDGETGNDRWTFQAGGPVLHACAVADGKVFFGAADGHVYALRATDGKLAWKFGTGVAVWNSPLVHDGNVYVASRNGKLYSLDAETGTRLWSRQTGASIVNSPAIDVARKQLVVGVEDMTVAAYGLHGGDERWRSVKFPGASFRGYHPVIAPDGSVMITCQPHAGGDAIQQVVLDMAKEVFGDFASWRHPADVNAKLREQNFKLMEDPATYEKQLNYLRQRLTDEPAYQTFFVLDGDTGKQKFVAPIVYAESMNGTGAPPVVTPNGKVIVKYSALLRSRYEHYSPFLNAGYLDTATGHITPVMDQTRTYGWHDSLLLVHDEQSQLSVGGKVLINAHQDNVNALDLETLRGYPAPFSHNVHEPPPGAAVGIWASYLAGSALPTGWEWFARGTAVYGGGSAIDVPVVVAGDSFYFVPTHEISAGCVLLAYRMKPDGKAADKAPPPKDKLSAEQWKSIQWSGRWDWDTLASPRLDLTLKSLPEPVAGTRQRPLTDAARSVVDAIRDVDLDYQTRLRFPENRTGPKPPKDLAQELDRAVGELISRRWRPLVLPAGKAPAESYRLFTDPSETLYTLALAFPHLSDERQQKVTQYVGTLPKTATYDPAAGAVRSFYDLAPDKLLKLADGVAPRSDTARLYPLWLWAFESNDWIDLTGVWPELRQKIKLDPEPDENDCGNARIAGLVAACRIAKVMKDKETEDRLVPALRPILRQRLVYELAHTRGGLITTTPDHRRSVFGRWRNLTPDVARLCRVYAPDVHAGLMDTYVDHHRPTWWLAWNVETLWANEVPTALPTESMEVFAARAMILNEPASKLQTYLDRPWCQADEYYIQKLALTLGNANGASW